MLFHFNLMNFDVMGLINKILSFILVISTEKIFFFSVGKLIIRRIPRNLLLCMVGRTANRNFARYTSESVS
jgi:hypothetical protein